MRAITFALLAGLVLSLTCNGAGIDELNAWRAKHGLPLFVEDPTLSAWAQKKAEWQAARHITLERGYNGHEGPHNPWGYVEGCGMLPAEWGWTTCARRAVGSHKVGCGMALGTDGNRYMCMIVAAKSIQEYPGQMNSIDTSHMTKPPLIPRKPDVPREPKGRWENPIQYQFDSPAATVVAPQPLPPICPKCGRRHS